MYANLERVDAAIQSQNDLSQNDFVLNYFDFKIYAVVQAFVL